MGHLRPSRREMLKAAGFGAGTAAIEILPDAGQTMKVNPFVLVHPAWHGGWCWKKITPLLQKAGHRVFTPTLTGLGERSHLARPEIGLEVHVSDIVNVLNYEALRDVVLVGHSSSGAIITGVADRAAGQIAHVVYLDAFVPENGQAVLDLVAPERRQALEDLVKKEGEGWLLPRFAAPPWPTIVREMWGVTDEGDARWMVDRLGPTPIGHFRDPVNLTSPAARALARTYVRCPRYPSARFDEHAAMAKRTSGWRFRELQTSHHPAVTAPDEVANLLLEVVSLAS
jgi:pimeloyl-ACP methyl ester carboxylesterase